jgi:hypothetical protein
MTIDLTNLEDEFDGMAAIGRTVDTVRLQLDQTKVRIETC